LWPEARAHIRIATTTEGFVAPQISVPIFTGGANVVNFRVAKLARATAQRFLMVWRH
jgi:outer membrane protein TolC